MSTSTSHQLKKFRACGRIGAKALRAIEREVRRCGFYIIRELSGHAIGNSIHEDPYVSNYSDAFQPCTSQRGPGP